MSTPQGSEKNGPVPGRRADTAIIVAGIGAAAVVIAAIIGIVGPIAVAVIQTPKGPPSEIPAGVTASARAPATLFAPLPPTSTFNALPPTSALPTNSTPFPASIPYFNIYTDSNVPTGSNATSNHFFPTGKMGDTDDIEEINPASSDNPHSGTSAIKIVYSARGQGTHICPMGLKSEIKCKWAGVYWLNPDGNWGTVPNAGYNLTGFRKLTFCGRTDPDSSGAQIKFEVGGVGWGMPTLPPFPDSLRPPRESGWQKLTDQWQCFPIELSDADLSYVIGGFAWVTNWDVNEITEANPKRLVFYLDDIRFER